MNIAKQISLLIFVGALVTSQFASAIQASLVATATKNATKKAAQ